MNTQTLGKTNFDKLAETIALLSELLPTAPLTPQAYAHAAVAALAGGYDPLPDVGQWCEAGVIYGYDGDLVICRQSHSRTIYPPEDTLALFIVYREDAAAALGWIAGESVLVGTRRTYDGTEYECLQAHVTQADWTPPNVPAQWRVVQTGPIAQAWVPGVYAPRVVGTRRDQSDPPLWVAPAGSVGYQSDNRVVAA